MPKSRVLRQGIALIILSALLLVPGCTPAEPGSTGTGGIDWVLIGTMAVVFVAFYFLMIRPQRKKQKEQEKMQGELKKGDKVITTAGIYGVIESTSEDSLVIRVESGATLRVIKNSVAVKRPN
ncbi:MAG: preprotein translocase subunit YajC [Chloroflexota bacterium]